MAMAMETDPADAALDALLADADQEVLEAVRDGLDLDAGRAAIFATTNAAHRHHTARPRPASRDSDPRARLANLAGLFADLEESLRYLMLHFPALRMMFDEHDVQILQDLQERLESQSISRDEALQDLRKLHRKIRFLVDQVEALPEDLDDASARRRIADRRAFESLEVLLGALAREIVRLFDDAADNAAHGTP